MLHLGKRPASYDRRDLRYTDIRPRIELPAVPVGWGRASDFPDGPPPAGWGMLGNGPCDDSSIPADWAASGGAGNCTIADRMHSIMQAAHDAGRTIPRFSCRNAVQTYATVSEWCNPGRGYDPVTGANDNGLEIRQVLKFHQQHGIVDDAGNVYKIGPYFSIEPGDWRSLREASWLGQSLAAGVIVTQANMDQFNAGQMWSFVRGSNELGGHDWPIMGHPWSGLWSGPTWQRKQLATWIFILNQCDEVWCYIDPERYSQVTGLTYNGYADADLERYFTVLAQTGGKGA